MLPNVCCKIVKTSDVVTRKVLSVEQPLQTILVISADVPQNVSEASQKLINISAWSIFDGAMAHCTEQIEFSSKQALYVKYRYID